MGFLADYILEYMDAQVPEDMLALRAAIDHRYPELRSRIKKREWTLTPICSEGQKTPPNKSRLQLCRPAQIPAQNGRTEAPALTSGHRSPSPR